MTEPSPNAHPVVIERDVPLTTMNSWHIGGKATQLIRPESKEQLADFFKQAFLPKHRVWLGLGSNVLIPDEGIDGLVICTRKLADCTLLDSGLVWADAGLTCAKFSKFCVKHGFANGAFFAGIPGTIGGALAMNAGAFGGETWEWVQTVGVLTPDGQIFERPSSDYTVGYRSVRLNQVSGQHPLLQEAFLGAYFKFPLKPVEDGAIQIKALLKKRNLSQPIGTLNCGSVYRNPEGHFAAKLIEESGMKGYKVGNISVSDKHANFIINEGHGTASDVLRVMQDVENAVWSKFQIRLEREVRVIQTTGDGVK